MEYSKKIIALASMLAIQSNAENLPGKTRNLNYLPINKHMWIQFSTSERESNNYLRDLAERCGDENFEVTMQFTVRPYRATKKLSSLEKFIKNPSKKQKAIDRYFDKLSDQADSNFKNFKHNNLKEMLFSPDQNGKTAIDIVQEKKAAGVPGAIMLGEIFDALKDELEQEERKCAERQELEDSVNKLAH